MKVLSQQMHVASTRSSRYKSWMLKTIYRAHKESPLLKLIKYACDLWPFRNWEDTASRTQWQGSNLRQSCGQAVVALVAFAVCVQLFRSVQSSLVQSPCFTETPRLLYKWEHSGHSGLLLQTTTVTLYWWLQPFCGFIATIGKSTLHLNLVQRGMPFQNAHLHHKLEGFFRKSEGFFRESESFFRRSGRLLPKSAGFVHT